jgi:hypothetical protein
MMAAVPGDTAESRADLEHNRQLLERWRTDPEHYARLQRDLRAFWALPPQRRERLRKLDRDFHKLEAPARERLWRVLERYNLWLEQLPEEERRQIEAADPGHRLRLIREVRQRQWIERLPARVRDDLLKLPADKRQQRVAQLQKEEQRHRREWQQPLVLRPRTPRYTQLKEFPQSVQDFVRNALLPSLDEDEKKRLQQADGGRWPELARTILELSERHPVLPALPGGKIICFQDLPGPAKRMVGGRAQLEKRTEAWQKLKRVEGRWPAWALTFHDLLTVPQRKQLPPLGASRPGEFSQAVQTFIDKQLLPALKPPARQRLAGAEGKWPEYPRLLLELAHRHNLHVPGMSLPGPRELWDAARAP